MGRDEWKTTELSHRTSTGWMFYKSFVGLRQVVAQSKWWKGHSPNHNSMANVFWWLQYARWCEACIVLISLNGLVSHHSYLLFFLCTNNVADYEVLLIGLELAAAMGMQSIHVNVNKGDSQLVVKQVIAEYQVIETKQQPYTKRTLDSIRKVWWNLGWPCI